MHLLLSKASQVHLDDSPSDISKRKRDCNTFISIIGGVSLGDYKLSDESIEELEERVCALLSVFVLRALLSAFVVRAATLLINLSDFKRHRHQTL